MDRESTKEKLNLLTLKAAQKRPVIVDARKLLLVLEKLDHVLPHVNFDKIGTDQRARIPMAIEDLINSID